ncbi:CopD family protein [Stenoxybacter acetivorans]|uniref:CopD family protein n=1 Tax=Stenoxybacter acetivorans TaxID=422441 RepID=UPI00055C052E|nr:CopD family protein [Stenoxybacter acetivorans]
MFTQIHQWLLLIHLLAATIWVGGHLIMAIQFMPRALKQRNPQILQQFEQRYEPIGMPALVLLVISGLWMASDFGVTPTRWFHFDSGMERAVSAKLILLLLTVGLALDARLRVLPKLTPNRLPDMAWHVYGVTLIGVLMLYMGVSLRYGGLS